MANYDRKIERALRCPTEMRFRDVEHILVNSGWNKRGTKGSHHIYVGPNNQVMTVPLKSGRFVKRQYIVNLIAILGLEEQR